MKKLVYILFLLIACQTEKKNIADDKKIYPTSSGLSSINLTSEKTENLVLLGKVWGFLKYYHPAVASGKYNWDFELFKILPQMISCKNSHERNAILYSWIESLGSVKKGASEKIDSSTVKCYPDLDWINETSNLGDTLSKKLLEIKNAKRTGKNFYVRLFPGVGNPDFKNEAPYAGLKYPDAGYRLLCLYRYWNIIEYFYPNKHLIGEDWDNVLTKFIPKFAEDTNESEYENTVSDLISEIHDTHAYARKSNSEKKLYYPLIAVSFVENKAVITSKDTERNPGLKRGDIILKVNNKTVEEIVKEKMSHVCASNMPTAMRIIALSLMVSYDSLLEITYQRGKEIDSAKIQCYSINEFPKMNSKKDTCFKYLHLRFPISTPER